MSDTTGQRAERAGRCGSALLAAATLLLAACAGSPEPPFRPREVLLFPGVERTPTADILLALPSEIAGLRAHWQVSVSSRRELGLGTGASLGYATDRPERRRAEVALIDLPAGEVPDDGVEGPIVKRELDRARGDLGVLAQRVPTSPAMPVPDVLDDAGVPVLRCFGFTMGGHLPGERDAAMSVVRCAGLLGGRLLLVEMTRAGLPLREARQPPPAPAMFGRALVAALRADAGRARSNRPAAPPSSPS